MFVPLFTITAVSFRTCTTAGSESVRSNSFCNRSYDHVRSTDVPAIAHSEAWTVMCSMSNVLAGQEVTMTVLSASCGFALMRLCSSASDDIRGVNLTSVFGPIAVEPGVEPGDCIFLILDDRLTKCPGEAQCVTQSPLLQCRCQIDSSSSSTPK
ncbi:hypothetical protein CY34DRAFT_504139 [Suillus luteus UH-Slu-Lm8-n1]|uniref:Uncharacterized protein n=1 Tax=Suillus luteus UH-Slu-Lm8-n1 TaxID=930992 RepID=A0A0D0A4S6_9AGAM|nr:hypothetical protein CY34DRAFT_504139 [Suillus luteus UH-Slu-Lm8-n1]